MSDGAAIAVVMSAERARQLEIKPLARYISFATAGYKPEEMGLGPVFAIPKALKLAGLKLSDMDVIELNEAFAAQSLAQSRSGTRSRPLNPSGGAIALGHPFGLHGRKVDGDNNPRIEASKQAAMVSHYVRRRGHGCGGKS